MDWADQLRVPWMTWTAIFSASRMESNCRILADSSGCRSCRRASETAFNIGSTLPGPRVAPFLPTSFDTVLRVSYSRGYAVEPRRRSGLLQGRPRLSVPPERQALRRSDDQSGAAAGAGDHLPQVRHEPRAR